MGCCLTTTAAAADDSKTNSKPRDAPPPPPPPPPGFGEETVKEVLSETPVTCNKPPPPPPPPPLSNSTPTKPTSENTRILHPEEEFRSKNVVVQINNNPIEENASDISSEIYSYSASYSAATTTTVGTGIEIEIDEDGEVTQKVNKPSPAKMVPRRQQAISSGERSRRKERGIKPPPPARRSVVRSTDKKPQLPSRNLTAEQRHPNVVSSSFVRREPPARRSRSPAMRGEAVQLRQVKDKSPVRKSGNCVPVNVTGNEVNVKLKNTDDGSVMPEPEPEPETRESLENPLVSLECFIFL